jgi:hypothetical protein
VQPVLDTIVATAQRLCQAERAIVWRLEGETFRAVAHSGQPGCERPGIPNNKGALWKNSADRQFVR